MTAELRARIVIEGRDFVPESTSAKARSLATREKFTESSTNFVHLRPLDAPIFKPWDLEEKYRRRRPSQFSAARQPCAVDTLESSYGRAMRRSVLALVLSLVAAPSARALTYEVYGKLNDMMLGYRIMIMSGDKSNIMVLYHDNAVASGHQLTRIEVPTSAIENDQLMTGLARMSIPLPGCNLWHEKMGQYRLSGGALEIATTVTQAELWHPDCKAGLKGDSATFKVSFPAMTREDRQGFGLNSAADMAACKLVHGRNVPLDGIVGRELTVYPNGWAHDTDGPYTFSQRFADMTVNTVAQIGPDAWANGTSFVFFLGDKVTVQRVVRSPRPGTVGGVRAYLVEIKRLSDGQTGIVDLDQLFAGSLGACPIERLVAGERGRMIPGVFLKLRQTAKPVYESSKIWVNDPALRYGFCQEFVEGKFHCQTREYGRNDLAPSSWTAAPDEVELVTDIPIRGQNISFRRPGS